MAIPRMNDDMNIISRLGDEPRVEDGLTPQQLKEVFDKAGLLIQKYINNTLIPYVENTNPDLDVVMKKAAPANLLDNSDFRNPVMQAGLNGFHGTAKYPIDRWISYDSDITLNDGYISVASPIDQRVSIDIVDAHKKYTAALCLSSGEIRCDCNTFENTIGSYGRGIYCYIPDDDVVEYVVVRIASNMDVKWAALYEGEYTIDTLPGYKSKGYGAELAECMRYYQKSEKTYCTASSNSVIPGVRFPIEMRTTPTVTIYDNDGNEGAVSCWTSSDGVKSVSATVAAAFTTCIWYLNASGCANAAVSFSYTASADL